MLPGRLTKIDEMELKKKALELINKFELDLTINQYPNELPEELKIFLPIQEIKNRHTCIKMPFEAFFKSIKN